VGAALAAAIESGKVKREDLFITTKVSPTSQDYCPVLQAGPIQEA
jgi:diketogulonate reductase-like aldo/keto reductase